MSKELKVLELFSGSGSQHKALTNIGIKSSTFFQRLKNGLNPFTGERV